MLNVERIRKMKADLTKTSFRLGDVPLSYETESKAATTIVGNAAFIEAGRSVIITPKQNSTISFGSEKPQYKSVSSDAMTYHGSASNFEKGRAEVDAMKTQLRKHNFTFGTEPLEYITDYASGFCGAMQGRSYADILAERQKQNSIALDTRKGHFSLGQDDIEYVSNTHQGQSQSGKISSAESIENHAVATEIKRKGKLTSVQIGWDPDYY